jgi:hypothetical protein
MGETTGRVGGRDLESSGSSLTRASYFITLMYVVEWREERGERRCMGSVVVEPGRKSDLCPWNGNQVPVSIIFVKSNSFMLHQWNIFFILLLIKKSVFYITFNETLIYVVF